MEKPLNIKQRNNMIGKFLLVCLIAACLIGYHVLISIDFYNTSGNLENMPQSELPATGSE